MSPWPEFKWLKEIPHPFPLACFACSVLSFVGVCFVGHWFTKKNLPTFIYVLPLADKGWHGNFVLSPTEPYANEDKATITVISLHAVRRSWRCVPFLFTAAVISYKSWQRLNQHRQLAWVKSTPFPKELLMKARLGKSSPVHLAQLELLNWPTGNDTSVPLGSSHSVCVYLFG